MPILPAPQVMFWTSANGSSIIFLRRVSMCPAVPVSSKDLPLFLRHTGIQVGGPPVVHSAKWQSPKKGSKSSSTVVEPTTFI